ncbi:hypothetical protein [Paracidovorax cattleyae]|uniref:Uncharacterized protein n=1 Tax=Paracidovorax cattleyae TaxID=80868 RepID=A0A1H0LY91_9BURK|nr:hypothetical protein [Paracidovorax cattleyae]AVS74297.1 hypothetical protein C8240_09925 [Paracidovorax cattleyae]SDO73074.1 hypothetical protein SAMN04489708_10334 [Paracidovorax cattleyae]
MSILPTSTALGPGARRLLAVTARAWGLRPSVHTQGAAVPHPHPAQRTARHAPPTVPKPAPVSVPAPWPRFAISY